MTTTTPCVEFVSLFLSTFLCLFLVHEDCFFFVDKQIDLGFDEIFHLMQMTAQMVFGKTSKFISFLYHTHHTRREKREERRETRRVFIFKRFFVKEISLAQGVCLLFF